MKALLVYNANEPAQNIRIEIKDKIVSNDQYQKIVQSCKPGPYLSFFQDMPKYVFRLRGPFQDSKQKSFYLIDCIGLDLSDKQKSVIDEVFNSNEY